MESRNEETTSILLPSQNIGEDKVARRNEQSKKKSISYLPNKKSTFHTLRGEHKNNSSTPLGRE